MGDGRDIAHDRMQTEPQSKRGPSILQHTVLREELPEAAFALKQVRFQPNSSSIEEPESAPEWYITLAIGTGAAIVILICLIITLALFQLLVRLQQRYVDQLLQQPSTKSKRPAQTSKDVKAQPEQTAPKELNHYEVAALINGSQERLCMLLNIANDSDPQAVALQLVRKGIKANRLKLSDESEAQVSASLASLAKVSLAMNKRRDTSLAPKQRLSRIFRETRSMVKICRAFQLPLQDSDERAMLKEEDDRLVDRYSEGAKHGAQGNVKATPQSALGAYFASEKWVDHAGILIIVTYSQLCGCVYAFYLRFRFPKMYAFMGPWVLVSRGEAMSIIITTVLMVLLLTRSFMTWLRPRVQWSTIAANMVDKHSLMHQWCAMTLPIYVLLHVLGHLRGSIPAIINTTDNDKVNEAFSYGTKIKFNFNSWSEAMICYPAVTGFILVLILVLFWALSNERVRRRYFEAFHYPHMFLILAWCGGLWAHGARQWLGCGVPLGLLAVAPVVAFYLILRAWDIARGIDPKIQIVNAVIKKKAVLLEVGVEGSAFEYETGMYCMLKVPSISNFEWHPFTIASAGGDPKLQVIFAVAGDWTEQFKALLETAQKKRLPYPAIAVRGGYGAPAQGMKDSKHVVLVGAGVGATPFLSFLASMCRAATEGVASQYDGIESAVFYWVSREPEDFVWINRYNSIISSTPRLRERVSVRLCMSRSLDTTATAECSAAEVAMFWLGAQVALMQNDKGSLSTELGAPTQFGRPDWHEELGNHGKELLRKVRAKGSEERLEINVFVCGNPMLVDTLEKACDDLDTDDVDFRLFAEQF